MISLIVAIDKNNAIGKENQLLCKLSDDMKNFVKHTVGKTVVMGRKTFDSLGSKPLPNRQNVVLSNSLPYHIGEQLGVVVVNNIESILTLSETKPSKEFVIIGGEEIYKQFLPYASKIYLTEIQALFTEADAFFPQYDKSEWFVTDEDSQKGFFQLLNEKNEYAFEFKILTKG